MLQGDTPVINTDPYATTPATPDDWVTHVGPHMMILIPDKALLKGISTDRRNGGPWIMWPDTPLPTSRSRSRVESIDEGPSPCVHGAVYRYLDRCAARSPAAALTVAPDPS